LIDFPPMISRRLPPIYPPVPNRREGRAFEDSAPLSPVLIAVQ
jgi:hypothetical protein